MASKITLQYGSKGAEVKTLQQFLNKNGYNLSVDGDFGNNTLNAVKDYQQKNGLSVDGIVGSNTWNKILYGSTSGNTGTYTPTAAPTLQAAPTLGTRDNTKYDETEEGLANKTALGELEEKQKSYGAFGMDKFTQAGWMQDILDEIQNYKKFSYDLNGDALYQQYKDNYIQQGKLAMEDAMGKASAMTGGYGSSYAQSVGQQAYQAQLDNLNDIVPELYQMALDRYNMDKEDLYNQYGLLGDLYDKEHAAHTEGYNMLMDSYGIASDKYYKGADMHYTEQDIANAIIDAENKEALSLWEAENNNAWKQAEWDESINQYANEDAWKQKEWDYMLEQDAKEEAAAATATENASKSYKGTTAKGDYNNDTLTNAQVTELQKALGVEVDGYYGKESSAAADGLSATEAYNKYVLGENVVAPAETQNTSLFINSYKTKSEFLARGHTVQEYYDYVESMIAQCLAYDKLTEAEALYLIEYYKIP